MLENQEYFAADGFINIYGPLIALITVVVLLLVVVAILKLKSKNKDINTKNVAGVVSRFFANRKIIQRCIKAAFDDATKGIADINNDGFVDREEFETYLISAVSKKAYRIIARTKIGLFISDNLCLAITTILLDSIIDESETTFDELFDKANKHRVVDEEIPVEEEIITNEPISEEEYIPPPTEEFTVPEEQDYCAIETASFDIAEENQDNLTVTIEIENELVNFRTNLIIKKDAT